MCAQTKIQISLRIRAVWSESSLSAWRNVTSLAIKMRLVQILHFGGKSKALRIRGTAGPPLR